MANVKTRYATSTGDYNRPRSLVSLLAYAGLLHHDLDRMGHNSDRTMYSLWDSYRPRERQLGVVAACHHGARGVE